MTTMATSMRRSIINPLMETFQAVQLGATFLTDKPEQVNQTGGIFKFQNVACLLFVGCLRCLGW